MDFKGAVLFCAFIACIAALEKKFTDEATYQDKINDRSIQEIARTHESGETNKKLDDVLVLMEQLEAREKVREKTYMNEIQNLRRQLLIQTRRTSSLERIVKSMSNKISNYVNQGTDKQEETSDDMQGPVKTLEEHVQPLNVKQSRRIRRAENENQVAFFATLNQHLTHVGAHQPITFNNVVTNIGNAYNSHFGSFTAPVSGTYVFSATLFSHYHSNYHAQFARNGQAITIMYMSGSESDYGTMSQTIVLQLQKGDDVGVQNYDTAGPIYGSNYSTFSGFLLQEDFSSVAVVGK